MIDTKLTANDVIAMKLSPIFNGISDDIASQYKKLGENRKFKKNSVIFVHESDSYYFYMIVKGCVKLFRETLSGDEAVVDVLNIGDFFGEIAIFENNKYSYSAEAVEDSEILMFPLSLLAKHIQENNKIAQNMLRYMSKNRTQQAKRIEHISLQNAPQRIGCFLLGMCKNQVDEDCITVDFPYDKLLVASCLAMKPETFSRALKTLKSEADIEITGATVTIKNINKLSEYCCGHCSGTFPCED